MIVETIEILCSVITEYLIYTSRVLWIVDIWKPLKISQCWDLITHCKGDDDRSGGGGGGIFNAEREREREVDQSKQINFIGLWTFEVGCLHDSTCGILFTVLNPSSSEFPYSTCMNFNCLYPPFLLFLKGSTSPTLYRHEELAMYYRFLRWEITLSSHDVVLQITQNSLAFKVIWDTLQ